MDNQYEGINNPEQQHVLPQQPPPQQPPPQYPPPQYPPPQQNAPEKCAPVKKPKNKYIRAVKAIVGTLSIIRSVLVVVLLFTLIVLFASCVGDVGNVGSAIPPMEPYFSVIRIEGAITGTRSFGDSGFDHYETMNYIKRLADNPLDRGILLYMNTPGGTIFHSDELYLALMEYKEITGRPIYAYMADMCASGGYYIAVAADHIIANRMTMTGSIGVISTLLDASGLFEELGLRTVIIDSGEHKGFGAMGTEITPSQVEVFQSITDEFFDSFVEVIAVGRSMDIATVRAFADGRIYTALQAYELGLVDEIGGWEQALSDFENLTEAVAFFPNLYTEVSLWDGLFGQGQRSSPQNEIDLALSRFEDLPPGMPLAVALELLGWR